MLFQQMFRYLFHGIVQNLYPIYNTLSKTSKDQTNHDTLSTTAQNANLDHNNEPIDVVELDEIHSYSKFKKNTCWTWIAIDRHKKHILGLVCGKRDTKSFQRLYNQLSIDNINLFCSDYWEVYQEVIPIHKHLQSKK